MSFLFIPSDVTMQEILPYIPFLQIYGLKDQQPRLYREEIQRRASTVEPYLVAIVAHDSDLVNRLLQNTTLDKLEFPIVELFLNAIRTSSYDIAQALLDYPEPNSPIGNEIRGSIDSLPEEDIIRALVYGTEEIRELAYTTNLVQYDIDIYPIIYQKYGRTALKRTMDFIHETQDIDEIIAEFSE